MSNHYRNAITGLRDSVLNHNEAVHDQLNQVVGHVLALDAIIGVLCTSYLLGEDDPLAELHDNPPERVAAFETVLERIGTPDLDPEMLDWYERKRDEFLSRVKDQVHANMLSHRAAIRKSEGCP